VSRGLEDAAGHVDASFRRLTGIRRGAKGHRLAALPRLPEVLDQAACVDLLHVDRSLEGVGIVEPEKLVRVTREAVVAAQLTATIRIGRPAERHRARVELAYEAFGSKLVIFNPAALV